MGGGRRRQPAIELVEAATGAHGGHCGGQPPARRGGVVDTVGADRLDAGSDGQLGQCVVALAVERVAVIPQLDEDVVAACCFDEPVELCCCGARSPCGSFGHECCRDSALAVPGEDRPLVTVRRRGHQEIAHTETRSVLAARHLGCRDQLAQRGVTGR